jgi:two-component system chemotaxis sensor kinase CheA
VDSDQERRQAARTRLIAKFRSTATDRLRKLANVILQLEREGYSESIAEEVKREIHTLKGEAKLVGFADVSFLVHKIEELILFADRSHFRTDARTLDVILTGFDEAMTLVDPAAAAGRAVELEEYVALVDKTLSGAASVESDAEPAIPIMTTAAATQISQRIEIEPAELEKVSQIVGALLEEQARRDRESAALYALVDRQRADLERITSSWQQVASATQHASTAQRDRFSEMTMLLAALRRENQDLRSVLSISREEGFSAALHLGELEERLRGMRMLPFSTLTDIYPRAVRDLARSLGKQVHVAITGSEVAVDTRVLALLGEPLIHLLRNAVDHGIEDPETRRQLGKPAEGLIEVVARHLGSRLVVTLRDDGRGLDANAIRAAALGKGLISPEQSRAMSDSAAQQLVFLPELSTRAEVTEISGRGIGLDVVKRRIENVGGHVTMDGTPNGGTWFELEVPISLALVHVLIVRAGSALWAIPSASIVAMLDPADVIRSEVAGVPAMRFEEHTIPIVDVPAQLGFGHESLDDSSRRAIVILEYGETRIGLEGMEILEYRSVVQRQADRFLEALRLIEGTAALGDRQVAIILSPAELVKIALQSRGARRAELLPEERASVVLVVDDSEIARGIVVDVLQTGGHRVLQAGNGAEALAVLQRASADLVFLDLDMPVMNGFEVLQAMRDDGRWRDLPVVVLSSRGSEADKRRALDLGADAYLVKSRFDALDLAETARTFLTRSARTGGGS